MIGGHAHAHGWMIVIGLLVLFTGNGESNPGGYCCMQDWEEFMGKVLAGFKTYAAELNSTALKGIVDTWLKKVNSSTYAELNSICQGHLQLKCVGVKNLTKCECNHDAPFAFVPTRNFGRTECVAGKEGSVCVPDLNPNPNPNLRPAPSCKEPFNCDTTNYPTKTGVCKKMAKGMKGEKGGTGKPGETDGGGNGTMDGAAAPHGARAYIESRVLWIIVPGLALLFST